MRKAVSGFDWDDGNRTKCRKHGVSIAEIEALFAGDIKVFSDPSKNEERLRAIGVTRQGRHVFIVYTLRQTSDSMKIRPISARYMHANEVRHYEQQAASDL